MGKNPLIETDEVTTDEVTRIDGIVGSVPDHILKSLSILTIRIRIC
jgi:hypothetical protein